MQRCKWKNLENSEIYQEYHDNEWGIASFDDKFMGSVTCFSYLEAVGIMNNHAEYCCKYTQNMVQ